MVDAHVQDVLDRLTVAEMDDLYHTMIRKERKRTKSDAILIADLLESQLKIVGLRDQATVVADIKKILLDLEIK